MARFGVGMALMETHDGYESGTVREPRAGKRGAFLLERLCAVGQSGVCVRTLGGDRAGEMRITRLLRNPKITPEAMFAAAGARTAGLVNGRHILAIQDTTTLRDDGRQHSLLLHPTIAVDAMDGALYGLVQAELLHRHGGKKASRKQRAFADKESRRWLTAAEIAAALLLPAGAACVTVVADREGDIYEEFACRPAGVELLIRAAQDRCLADGRMLFKAVDGLAALGRVDIALPAAPGRPARTAILELRACPVRLARPGRPKQQAAALPATVDLTLVEAREINAPDGVEPAHWQLLTTHAVTNLAEARIIVGFYRNRWVIEQLFRTYKTHGFNIEAVRIADEKPFETLASATLIAAVQVMQLVRDRDGLAGRPLQDVFDAADQPALEAVCATLEGKTERQKNPHPPGSLAYAAWVCARLGGWTGYYGKPGPIVTLRGLLKFKAIAHGWNLGRIL
jgi:hypothetical protein